MNVSLDKAESAALEALRGLPDGAHMLLMCSHSTPDGTILDGSEDAFRELVEFIGEEIGAGMVSARRARALASLCAKIDPDCLDWLGQ